MGQTVTVSAEVTDVLSPQSFELAGQDWGDESLLVVSVDEADVQDGEVVRVTGEVGSAFVYADYANDYTLGNGEAYAIYDGENFIIADSVEKNVPEE